MRSILTLYMMQYLLFAQQDAKAYFHYFVMANYLTPLVGGWIADRFWGRYHTILWIPPATWRATRASDLGRRPRASPRRPLAHRARRGRHQAVRSAFVGDQFGPTQTTLMQRVYGWFYWSINLGSASANLLIPSLLEAPRALGRVRDPGRPHGARALCSGRGRALRAGAASGPDPHGFLRVVGRAVRRLARAAPASTGRRRGDQHPAEAVEGAKAVFRIMAVFAAVTLFRTLFDQKAPSWVIQASQMDLVVGGWEMSPAQLQAANPFLVMMLILLFTWGVFRPRARGAASSLPR